MEGTDGVRMVCGWCADGNEREGTVGYGWVGARLELRGGPFALVIEAVDDNRSLAGE